jgi:hypothetical protein
MFNGCKGAPCKCAAVGVICLCVAATSHGQFCEQQHRPTYCNPTWDLPHGPESETVQGHITFVSTGSTIISTSSSSTGAETQPHFIASFKPTKIFVWPGLFKS